MRAVSSASSSSVSRALSPNCSGRSIGVALLLAQMPCRSGCPSAVRGTVQPSGSCPAAACGNIATPTAAITNADANLCFLMAAAPRSPCFFDFDPTYRF